MRKKDNTIPYKILLDYKRDTPKALEYLMNGGIDKKIISKLITEGLDLIDERYDCSDFRCEIFIRILYQYNDVIGTEIENIILNTLLNFPFEETSGNSMCTWTENHQLVFDVCAYLLAQKYNDKLMYNNEPASLLYARARSRMIDWSDFIFKFGFSEFGSCNYYPETLAALGNIIEFSEEEEIKNRFKIVLDLLIYDIVSQSLKNNSFNIACARAYVDNKVNFRSYMECNILSLLGENIKTNNEREACFFLMLKAKNKDGKPIYTLPKAILNIFNEKERVIKCSNGLELSEYKKNGLIKYSEKNTRYTLASGALIDPKISKNVIRYFDSKNMWDNSMLSSLYPFRGLIKNTPLLYKMIKGLVRVSADDMVYGRGNTYTYIKDNYSLSSLTNYHLNKGSFQQSTNIINLDGLSIFTTSPSKDMSKTGSPDYWIGSCYNPDIRQEKDLMVMMYKFKGKKKFGFNKSHIYLPIESFDETDLSLQNKGYIFGRYHNINIMVKTNEGVNFIDSTNDLSLVQDGKMAEFNLTKYDLFNESKSNHYYIFKVDNTLSLDEFKKEMLDTELKVNGDEIIFGKMKFKYNSDSFYDNHLISTKYHRFEGKYILNGYYDYDINNPLVIKCLNDSLIIDFNKLERMEKHYD